jgi:hypothetical protein
VIDTEAVLPREDSVAIEGYDRLRDGRLIAQSPSSPDAASPK